MLQNHDVTQHAYDTFRKAGNSSIKRTEIWTKSGKKLQD